MDSGLRWNDGKGARALKANGYEIPAYAGMTGKGARALKANGYEIPAYAGMTGRG